MWVACEGCENPEGFPPFPVAEGVLATDTGKPDIIAGADIVRGIEDEFTRSITEYERVALSDVASVAEDPKCSLWTSGLILKLCRPLANSALIS